MSACSNASYICGCVPQDLSFDGASPPYWLETGLLFTRWSHIHTLAYTFWHYIKTIKLDKRPLNSLIYNVSPIRVLCQLLRYFHGRFSSDFEHFLSIFGSAEKAKVMQCFLYFPIWVPAKEFRMWPLNNEERDVRECKDKIENKINNNAIMSTITLIFCTVCPVIIAR